MKGGFTACNFFWYFLKSSGKTFLSSSFRYWLGSWGTWVWCLAGCTLPLDHHWNHSISPSLGFFSIREVIANALFTCIISQKCAMQINHQLLKCLDLPTLRAAKTIRHLGFSGCPVYSPESRFDIILQNKNWLCSRHWHLETSRYSCHLHQPFPVSVFSIRPWWIQQVPASLSLHPHEELTP